jgi:hypothetical protein
MKPHKDQWKKETQEELFAELKQLLITDEIRFNYEFSETLHDREIW